MSKKKIIEVLESDAGQRIDLYLSDRLSKTRSFIKQLIKKGNILLNGKTVKSGYKIKCNDIIEITIPEEQITLKPEPIPLEILYKDQHVAVINKPPGLVMYPSAGHQSGTLMNALAYHIEKLASVGGPLRPGVVQRLDKDTSGVVVVALSEKAYYVLVDAFKKREIKRTYYSIVFGHMKEKEGEIELPIGRSKTHRKKMSTRVKRGRFAKTYWKVIEEYRNATLIEVRLATGRTHQIRVHFSSIGHPVLGDSLYGRKTSLKIKDRTIKIPRQMLHAFELGFVHPVTGEWLEFSSPMPEDMLDLIQKLRDFQNQ